MNEIIWTRNALRFSTHVPQENVKALTLWSSWVFTRQNRDFTRERELMQGYLGVSELLFQLKDIKACFRAFFPKLCLKESSSLVNLRWPSSLAIKCLDLTACCFSPDTHLTCLSWDAPIFPEARKSIFLLSICQTLLQCYGECEPAGIVPTLTMEKWWAGPMAKIEYPKATSAASLYSFHIQLSKASSSVVFLRCPACDAAELRSQFRAGTSLAMGSKASWLVLLPLMVWLLALKATRN